MVCLVSAMITNDWVTVITDKVRGAGLNVCGSYIATDADVSACARKSRARSRARRAASDLDDTPAPTYRRVHSPNDGPSRGSICAPAPRSSCDSKDILLLGLLDESERIVVVGLREAQHDHALECDLGRLHPLGVEILEKIDAGLVVGGIDAPAEESMDGVEVGVIRPRTLRRGEAPSWTA